MDENPIEDEIVLTFQDKSSPLWAKIRAHLGRRLDYAQRRLERTLDEQNTNIVRGEIATLRHLIRLEDDVIVTHDADPSHL